MSTWKQGEDTGAELIDQMLNSIPDEELRFSSRRGKSKTNQPSSPRDTETRLAALTKQNAQYESDIRELKAQLGDQEQVLEAIDSMNSLVSFKMADLVNKAVKAGRYTEVFEEDQS